MHCAIAGTMNREASPVTNNYIIIFYVKLALINFLSASPKSSNSIDSDQHYPFKKKSI